MSILRPEQISEEQMQPYRDPAHWDGHEIGQVALGAIPKTVDRSPLNMGHRLYALETAPDVLRDRLRGYYYDHHLPTSILDEGAIFKPQEHARGTVVAYGVESLVAQKRDEPIPAFVKSSDELYRLDTQPFLAFGKSNSLAVQSQSLTYAHQLRWGVVVGQRKGNRALVTTGDRWISRNYAGKVSILFPGNIFLQTEADTLQVGTVTGGITSKAEDVGKPTPGALQRYTNVHVFEPRQPRRRISAFNLL